MFFKGFFVAVMGLALSQFLLVGGANVGPAGFVGAGLVTTIGVAVLALAVLRNSRGDGSWNTGLIGISVGLALTAIANGVIAQVFLRDHIEVAFEQWGGIPSYVHSGLIAMTMGAVVLGAPSLVIGGWVDAMTVKEAASRRIREAGGVGSALINLVLWLILFVVIGAAGVFFAAMFVAAVVVSLFFFGVFIGAFTALARR